MPQPKSYERINYQLRPAKNIERKMLVETLRRLTEFGKLSTYRYIGFGSTYFSDFSLFHKALDIRRMVSVERDMDNSERFRFNRPFACVQLAFGESNDVLPLLNWKSKVIVWLDYDDKLNAKVLTDINHFCTDALPGSVLIISVNAHPDKVDSDRVQLLRGRVGAEKVPQDLTHAVLADWGTAVACRRIVTNEIMQRMNERNGGLEGDKRLLYRQLFNFHYADGAKMLTVGGVIFEERQLPIFERCAFARHSRSVRTGEEPYLIHVPNLTFREIHYLDSQLPTRTPSKLKSKAVPNEDVERYAEFYRYFPRFAESEV